MVKIRAEILWWEKDNNVNREGLKKDDVSGFPVTPPSSLFILYRYVFSY